MGKLSKSVRHDYQYFRHPWWTRIGILGFVVFVCDSILNELGFKVKNHRFPIKVKGFEHPFWGRFGTSDVGVFNQIFNEREYACLIDVKNPKLIIDCGANVGYSSLWFLHHYPNANLIAVEPDSGNFELCQMNLAPYKERVRLVQSGIWSHEIGLLVVREESKDRQEWAFQVRECREGEIPHLLGTDIGSLLNQSGFEEIDILKVDIETAEKIVFAKNYEPWLRKVKNIVIELHNKECEEVFLKALAPYNYDLSRSGELTVCKNISLRVPERIKEVSPVYSSTQ